MVVEVEEEGLQKQNNSQERTEAFQIYFVDSFV